VNPAFWRGRKVFLTGHTGFKGGWLALWLQHLGARVTGYALPPPTTPSLYEVAAVGTAVESIFGDIRDHDALVAAIDRAEPEVVFHLAAQPLVRYSYAHPVETYGTNVLGLVHLLEGVRRTSSVRAVVNVTTDKCYENHEWIWGYRENDRLGGHDPYSNSKACAELVTAAYRDSFFAAVPGGERQVALASARAGNVIGGGDWALDRLVPDMLRAVERGEPVLIRSPHAIRPWQHVLEPLAGYLLLAERLHSDGQGFGEAWNFGPVDAEEWPVQRLVERLTAAWGEGAAWRLDERPQPHEASYLKLDATKAVVRLGWKPRWSVGQALEQIVAWHRAFHRGSSMRDVTLSQIEQYSQG
jgi:CDP-glucose 4,6-dehydratase